MKRKRRKNRLRVTYLSSPPPPCTCSPQLSFVGFKKTCFSLFWGCFFSVWATFLHLNFWERGEKREESEKPRAAARVGFCGVGLNIHFRKALERTSGWALGALGAFFFLFLMLFLYWLTVEMQQQSWALNFSFSCSSCPSGIFLSLWSHTRQVPPPCQSEWGIVWTP